MAVTAEAVLAYLRDNCHLDTSKVENDTTLFSSSLLDSFSMVDLIVFVEGEGGFKMGATEVSLDNLDTVGSIVAYCERKSA